MTVSSTSKVESVPAIGGNGSAVDGDGAVADGVLDPEAAAVVVQAALDLGQSGIGKDHGVGSAGAEGSLAEQPEGGVGGQFSFVRGHLHASVLGQR